MKIHIIGCSGCGKTYLAKYLSEKHNIPHIDLDDLQWDTSASYGTKRHPDAKAAMLKKALMQECWVIEGVYYAWVGQSFDEADIIYVLDMPVSICRWRILRRFIKRKPGLQQGKQETWISLYHLMRWTRSFQDKNLKEIRIIMKQYSDKTIWLSTRKEVYKIMEK